MVLNHSINFTWPIDFFSMVISIPIAVSIISNFLTYLKGLAHPAAFLYEPQAIELLSLTHPIAMIFTNVIGHCGSYSWLGGSFFSPTSFTRFLASAVGAKATLSEIFGTEQHEDGTYFDALEL